MKLASHRNFQGTLRQFMEQTSFREYRTWVAWLEHQWDEPSRGDQYLMQIAMEVARVLSTNKKAFKREMFRIPFDLRRPKISPKQSAKMAKSRWWMALSPFGKAKEKDGPRN